MSEPLLDRHVRHRLAVLRHAEEVTGNVAMTCRHYGITRQSFYTWKRRYEEEGPATRPGSLARCALQTARCGWSGELSVRRLGRFAPVRLCQPFCGAPMSDRRAWLVGCYRAGKARPYRRMR